MVHCCVCQALQQSPASESPSSTKRRKDTDSHACAVCLSSITSNNDPRIFPCNHTFCAQCVQGVADCYTEDEFPCPVCRRKTFLPPGGVASLPINFEIVTPQLKPSEQDMCMIHDKENVEFYCVDCDQAICVYCKSTNHESHRTQDIISAASQKQAELLAEQHRLLRAVSDVTKRMTSLRELKQDLVERKNILALNIKERYDVIKAAAGHQKYEALGSLGFEVGKLVAKVSVDTREQKNHRLELFKLIRQLNNALACSTASDVITVSREMRTGQGSQSAIHTMTSQEDRRALHRLLIESDVSTDAVVKKIEGYLGNLRQLELKETVPEMRKAGDFRCSPWSDVEIFSLCHLDSDPPKLLVAYERLDMRKDNPVEVFTEEGAPVVTAWRGYTGKVSHKRYDKGDSLYQAPYPGWFVTYCKSPTSANFTLSNNLSGQAIIRRVIVASTNPFPEEGICEFAIQVGPHRAFDVNDTEQYFAVVEEDEGSTARRSVHLYQRSMEKAVSTYTPPTEEFQPSDVCFYTLRGQKVLLITDERMDAIHVVRFDGGSMVFDHYLLAGCPNLIQPTAITVDVQDRLWVACRGGAILKLEQIK
ncbi:hypothetical protein ACOMHN_045614 [Nucella lapillus]